MAELARRPDFTLGALSVSPSARALRGPEGEAALEPRTMQVLVSLADAGGAVVTREDLFRRCWGAGAIASDDSLNHAVADLRRALRTAVGDQVAIGRVPRTGYRLVAHDVDGAPSSPVTGPGRMSRRAAMAAGAAVVVGGMVWAVTETRRLERIGALMAESTQVRRIGLPEGDRQAVSLLRQALDIDPRRAAAWGQLALAQCSLAEAAPPGRVARLAAEAQASAQRALALSPSEPDALAALAILPPYFGDWYAAEARLRAVLTVDPDNVASRDALAFMLSAVGREREASLDRIALAEREPLHANIQFKLVYAYWLLGRLGDADRAAERAMQLWPKHPGVWLVRLWTLAFTGRADRGLAHVQDASARPPLPPWMFDTLAAAMRALADGGAGERAAASALLIADVARSPSAAVHAVMLLSALGAVDRAFEVAEAYLLQRGPLMAAVRWKPGQLQVHDQRRRKTNMLFVPPTAAMRLEPRFAALVEDVGLTDYWRRSGAPPDYQRGE